MNLISQLTALKNQSRDLPFDERAAFLKESTARFAGQTAAAEPGLRARESLVQVLFNHNDFVTVR